LRHGAHPFNTLSIGNRVGWTWVLIEERHWPRFILLTPADPEAFVKEIGPIGDPGPRHSRLGGADRSN